MTAKLFIDGDERELHYVDMDYNRITSFIGWPVSEIFGGLIHLRFTPRGDEDFFLNWMFAQRDLEYPRCLYTFKNGEVVFYEGDVTEDIFFKYRFADCILIRYKETFSNQWGMETEMVLSPAIQYYNHKSKYPFLKRWNESYIPPSEQTPYQAMEHEPEIDLKFIARFKRMDSYKGEFGFDWMRDDYLDNEDGTKGICENQVALKKEYTPTKIHEQDYFVPWLSMFPKQEGVKLKLSIKEIEGTRKASDIIKLSSKNGIKFVPDELKVSEANGKEITILCESPLSNDTKINLLDKNDNTVGKINVFKNDNHKQLHFDITPVRILRSVSVDSDKKTIENQIDIEGLRKNDDGTETKVKGWGDKNKDLESDLTNLEGYLNKNSLNQALLQCTIGKVYDITIDEDVWIKDDLIIEEGCVFKDGEVLEKFYEIFKKQHPVQAKKRGLIMFLSPLRREGAGGQGEIREIDAKRLVIYQSNLWKKDSFSHEISHVLGLTHSFQIKSSTEDVFIMNKFIKQVDDYLNYLIRNNKPQNEITNYWSKHKDRYKEYRTYLNLFYRNPYIFEKAKTENFMDYDNVRKSFWKYQWKAMQDDVIKFYNIK